jgi:hypothetical protein
MVLDYTNVLVSLLVLQQRKVPQPKAALGAVAAGFVRGPIGLAIPLLVVRDQSETPATLTLVPDLVNQEEEKAKEMIRSSGLKPGTTTRAYSSEGVKAGLVAAQDPEAGEVRALDTEVDLTVSSGAVPVEDQRPPQNELLLHEVLVQVKESLAENTSLLQEVKQKLTEIAPRTEAAPSQAAAAAKKDYAKP